MTRQTRVVRGAAIGLCLAGMVACQSRLDPITPAAGQTAAPAPAAERSAPSLEELRNATYSGVAEAGASFTLSNGKWEGQPFVPGGASRPGVTMVRDLRLVGDLDGDRADDAAVLLAANAGGTGEMSYLAVVGRRGGKVVNLATAAIGDRVQVREAKLDGRRIVLDLVQAGEQDAACCPGDLVTRTWELEAGALKQGAPTKTGRLSIAAIAGAEWVLKAWGFDEAAPAGPEVTLKLDNGRLAGSAGCNNYFASVRAGDAPGDLSIGPAGTTRKMCPETEMAVETRFLQQLQTVVQLRFAAGRLALSYAKTDKAFGVMLFDRRVAQ